MLALQAAGNGQQRQPVKRAHGGFMLGQVCGQLRLVFMAECVLFGLPGGFTFAPALHGLGLSGDFFAGDGL